MSSVCVRGLGTKALDAGGEKTAGNDPPTPSDREPEVTYYVNAAAATVVVAAAAEGPCGGSGLPFCSLGSATPFSSAGA